MIFEVFIDKIALQKEGASRAIQLTDNKQDCNKKPKAYKNVKLLILIGILLKC